MTSPLPRRLAFLACIASILVPCAAPAGTSAERTAFLAAYQAARHAPTGAWKTLAHDLADYPLYPYLEWAALGRDLTRADPAAVAAFLSRNGDTPFGAELRGRWLERLATQKRWREFLDLYQDTDKLELRCAHASARVALADTAQLLPEAKALWLTGRSLPSDCDPAVAWLKSQREYGPDLVWERLRLAAAAREIALVRHLATLLPAAQRTEGERWANTIANPGVELARVAGWSDTPRYRELASLATAQLARKDAARAGQLWLPLSQRLKFTEAERALALNAIALQKGASYLPDSAQWFARIPPALVDDVVRELRVREALARGDYAAAMAGLEQLTPEQQADTRWRYVRARVLDARGRKAEAQAALAALAREPGYHGFLAADRIGSAYALCPLQDPSSGAVVAAVARDPGLVRAFELHALGWSTEARREWAYALRDVEPEFRRAAVVAANAHDWIDRGPLTLLKPEDQRWYELRFPLAHTQTVNNAARRAGLEPALVLAIIRSESAWMHDARSGADARGLMQLLPSVGAQVARREKIPYRSVADLFEPRTNIMLGTRYLADEIARQGGAVWLAAAAYNAGPAPVARWRAARPGMPVDLWVETIPYKETREYVSRVIAFATIYEWRLQGKAAPISNRLKLGLKLPAQRDFVCPTEPPRA